MSTSRGYAFVIRSRFIIACVHHGAAPAGKRMKSGIADQAYGIGGQWCSREYPSCWTRRPADSEVTPGGAVRSDETRPVGM